MDKFADIEQRIRTLQRMHKSLRKLVNARHAISDCPILDSLDKEACW